MNESVTISVKAYNALRDEIAALQDENAMYETAFEEIRAVDGQRVLVKEKTIHEDEVVTEVWLKCFDDVKEEVEKAYGKRIEDLESLTKKLKSRIEDLVDDKRELADKLEDARNELEEIRERGLWARICNK